MQNKLQSEGQIVGFDIVDGNNEVVLAHADGWMIS